MGFERIYDYGDAPTIRRFNESKKFYRLLSGPFGCLSGNSLVITEEGPLQISEIDHPMRVLSWNDQTNQFQFSLTGGAFPKGTDYLYRVSTQQGEFVGAGYHRVFCEHGKYRLVEDLCVDDLLLYSNDQTQKQNVSCQKLFYSSGYHYSRIISSLMGCYAKLIRLYDRQLHFQEDICQEVVQELNDVLDISYSFDVGESLQKDDLLHTMLLRIRQDRFFFQQCIDDFSLLVENQRGALGGQAFWQLFVRILLKLQAYQQLLWHIDFHHTIEQSSECLSSSSSLTEWPILSIKRLNVKEKFWDMQVLETHNYVTSDGTIHHNSGKSSGCIAEIIDIGMNQVPNKEGIRKTRWAVVRNCYDEKTEVLTEKRGWKLFKDLQPDDRVASLHGNELQFDSPSYYYAARYDGEMIGFENEGCNFLVTPDHKMHISMRNAREKRWENYRLRTAKDIFGKQNTKVKRNAEWEGVEPQYPLEFMEWFGFWIAEGSAAIYRHDGYPKYRCVITQSGNLDYVRGIFKKANIPFTENKRGGNENCTSFLVRINEETKKIIDMLLLLGKAIDKRVPQWLKDSPPEYIQSFLYGYLMGDGAHKKRGTETASTASKQLADDIQELALRAGYVVNVSKQKIPIKEMYINGIKTKQNSGTVITSFVKPCKYEPMLKVGGYAHKYRGWYKEQYSGMVYCVEVPTHVIYVRRNGKAFWCSQTYKVLLDTTMATFFYWLPPEHFGEYNVTNFQYTINKIELADGSKVEIDVRFRALDKEEQLRNLLSLELTGAWFNELREIPKIISDTMEGRVNRFPAKDEGGPTWTGIIADTNPPDTDSWIYKFYEEKLPNNIELASRYEMFKQPSGRSDLAENLKHLPGGRKYYTDLAIGKDPEYVKVYIDGEYGYLRDGKPVYPNYSDTLHLAPEPIKPVKGFPILVGMDFALNPAASLCQYLPTGKFNVIHELIGSDMGLRRFISEMLKPYIMSTLSGYELIIIGDPAGIRRNDTDERSCFDELRAAGFPATPAPTNAFLARYNAVDSLLTKLIEGKAAFQLSPACKVLHKGFLGEYKLKKFKMLDDQYSEVPVKNMYSHIHDALEYACLMADNSAIITRTRQHMGSRYNSPSKKSSDRSLRAWY
jgi:hypothetical protein